MSNNNKSKPTGFNLGKVKVEDAIKKSDGEWLHLKHPTEGWNLWAGGEADIDGYLEDEENPNGSEPIRVKVRSYSSTFVKESEFKLNRQALKKRDDVNSQTGEINRLKLISSMICGFEHVYDENGRALDANNAKDRMYFLRTALNFADQVYAFGVRSSNYFKLGSEGSSQSEPEKAG